MLHYELSSYTYSVYMQVKLIATVHVVVNIYMCYALLHDAYNSFKNKACILDCVKFYSNSITPIGST